MMKNFLLFSILSIFLFSLPANSQIKIGKPPSGGGGSGSERGSIQELLLKGKIDKFVKIARKNAKDSNLKFEKANFVDFASVIRLDQSMLKENCSEMDASGGDSYPDKKELGKLSGKLFDKKSLKLLNDILKDERLFKEHLQRKYNITDQQAKDVFETYKWLLEFKQEK